MRQSIKAIRVARVRDRRGGGGGPGGCPDGTPEEPGPAPPGHAREIYILNLFC